MNRAELLHKKNFPPEGQTRQANCPHSPSICLAARCPVSSPLNEIPAMLDMIDLNLGFCSTLGTKSPIPFPEWLFSMQKPNYGHSPEYANKTNILQSHFQVSISIINRTGYEKSGITNQLQTKSFIHWPLFRQIMLYSRPELPVFYTLSQTELPENHTFHSSTKPCFKFTQVSSLSLG